MKIVLDTNVFVSAAFKELSWPGMVVRWVEKFGGLLKTPATEQEVDVLRRPRIAENTVPLFAARLRRIFAAAELVTITERIAACRDRGSYLHRVPRILHAGHAAASPACLGPRG